MGQLIHCWEGPVRNFVSLAFLVSTGRLSSKSLARKLLFIILLHSCRVLGGCLNDRSSLSPTQEHHSSNSTLSLFCHRIFLSDGLFPPVYNHVILPSKLKELSPSNPPFPSSYPICLCSPSQQTPKQYPIFLLSFFLTLSLIKLLLY